MTNNNNEDIEIITDNNYDKEEIKKKKNYFKVAVVLGIGFLVLAGAGVFAYEKYENAQELKKLEAYSKIRQNESNTNSAQNNNQSASNTNSNQQQTQNVQNQNSTTQNIAMKTDAELKKIVASAIGVVEENVIITKIQTDYENDYATQNNGQALYVYEIDANANGLRYDIDIDANTGKVLKVKIEN